MSQGPPEPPGDSPPGDESADAASESAGPQSFGRRVPDPGHPEFTQSPYAGPPGPAQLPFPGQFSESPDRAESPDRGLPGQQPVTMSDQRLWGTLAHVSVPFIGFVGPLILFVVFKDRSALIRANAVEALNFSILYLGVALVAALLIPLGVGAVLLPLAGVATLVFCAMGAISANKGEAYKYPLNWRLVR